MKKTLPGATLAAVIIALFLLIFLGFGTPQTLSVNADSGATATSTVTQLWNFTTDSYTVSSPVVADDLVYIRSSSTLYCINASTGTQVWKKTGPSFNAFTVANGYVYVGATIVLLPSLQGVVFCLNASNGAQLWNYSYGTSFSSAVVDEGIVYAAGFSYTLSTDTNIGFVYAFNASTGTKIWNYIGPVGTHFDYNSLVLASANLYAVSVVYSEQDSSWHSGVYAFNAHTGEELWNYTTPGQFSGQFSSFSSLAAAGQRVYVSSAFVNTTGYINFENTSGYVYAGGVLALNAVNGARIWNYPINSYVGTPIIANDKVYAVAGDGNVYAFGASDGKVVWNSTVGLSPGSAFVANIYLSPGSALTANNYLYVGSPTGVNCFDASNGAAIWNFTDTDYAYSFGTYPVYADGVIYMGWNGFSSSPLRKSFYAFDALNGQKLWNYTIGYIVQHPPLVVGNIVYIGSGYASGPGAVIALKSTIALPPSPSPSPSTPFSASTTTLIAVEVIAVIVVLAIVSIAYRRKTK